MKKLVIFSLSIFLTLFVIKQNFAQESAAPKFKGDPEINSIRTTDDATLINNYLVKHVQCPEQSAICRKEGTEVIRFVVSEEGELKDFEVINSVCPALDEEVIRVLKTTNGMWTPVIKDGEKIAMTHEVAFMFGDRSSNTMVNYFVTNANQHYRSANKSLFVRNNPKKALRHLNMGINYMPNDKALLRLRGLCNYELGDLVSARKDWGRIIDLGGIPHMDNIEHMSDLKGFEEMNRMLAEK